MEDGDKGGQTETTTNAEDSLELSQAETTSDKTELPDDQTKIEDVRLEMEDVENEDDKIVHREVGDNQTKDNKITDGKDEKEKKIEDEDNDEKKDVEKPLIDEKETVAIDLGGGDEKHSGGDSATLPLPVKVKSGDRREKSPSIFLHPIDSLRHAWINSRSISEFLLRAVCIIIVSLGWVFCIGGVPLLPLIMLIMGSIFLDECPIEPNIPVYLIVAGFFGLIQHASVVIGKYLPNDSRGIIKSQKRTCLCIDGILQTFLFFWFIAGCVWVYRIYEPNYEGAEYCHKTVYLFTFWMLNVSFIVLCSIIVFGFCVILRVSMTTDKN